MVRKKVAVAMSGGVDSSVTAALLKQQGYDVFGLTMDLFPPGENGSVAARDARHVAECLDIPHHLIDCRDFFQEEVIRYFCAEYHDGRTPNPCVRCNALLKFGHLFAKAREFGADYLATGHYARIATVDGEAALCKGTDHHKDQSYFLFVLKRENLDRILFPLGEYKKSEVRQLAAQFALPVHEKPESQDICFVPDGDHVGFIEARMQERGEPGPLVHVSGKILGKHRGIYCYTIGQRRGLGVGWSEPLYVVEIDAEQNRVVVGERHHLLKRELLAGRLNWLISEPSQPFVAKCRIRYRHRETEAEITPFPGGRVQVNFAEPQQGITPGQAAVFFADDRVLGGGWIEA